MGIKLKRYQKEDNVFILNFVFYLSEQISYIVCIANFEQVNAG